MSEEPTDEATEDATTDEATEDATTDDATDAASDSAASARESTGWTDLIIGERMQVDREFGDKVGASNFSRQQWGLIMTAVEFDIEGVDEPESARLVADTSKLEAVLPEIERMAESTGGPPGSSGMGGGRGNDTSERSDGVIDGIKRSLGLGGDAPDREQQAAAEELAQMYADDLEERLRETGKWERVCLAARD